MTYNESKKEPTKLSPVEDAPKLSEVTEEQVATFNPADGSVITVLKAKKKKRGMLLSMFEELGKTIELVQALTRGQSLDQTRSQDQNRSVENKEVTR